MELNPIGVVHTSAKTIPRHWSVSDIEGILRIRPGYTAALRDIRPGQRIIVIFLFHKSPEFTAAHLFQTPPNRNEELGVFSICSPVRPNPIGMSVLEVLSVDGGDIGVIGLDMLDGTPVIDIKPHIENREDCPSSPKKRQQ